jgi:cold shock CspA family protein
LTSEISTFIKPDGCENDIFVHYHGLIDRIIEDSSGEYDVEEGRNGTQAVNVKTM